MAPRSTQRSTLSLLLTSICAWQLACAGANESVEARAEAGARATDAAAPDVPRNPEKDAYFGDLHLHSSWSLDAYSFQVRVGPEDAYRYARGQAIDHVSGRRIQLQGPPLDFIALTEHANYMGLTTAIQTPNHPMQRIPLIRDLSSSDPAVAGPAMQRVLAALGTDTPITALVDRDLAAPAWRRLVELAERHSLPGEFTAFAAYEYTAMPAGQNLHRNVIFRGSNVPELPFSAFDSQNPEDLWAWMDAARVGGDDVIAIPHNGNGSNGLMYQRVDDAGRPIDAAYAEIRLRNEPVSEVMQIKGQSETLPSLSPEDEWADFSILDTILGRPEDPSRPEGSYARLALRTGLEMEQTGGFNPYRFGMIGASDGHNAASPVEEDNYTGKIGIVDGTPESRILPVPEQERVVEVEGIYPPTRFGAAGLAGVWAEANERGAIFDALRARETFATSGPRIRVRLFAGWDFTKRDLGQDMVAHGYRRGVPMGSVMSEAPPGADAPTLLVRALRDPREAPLERLQIIKAWIEADVSREKVFDIACADGEAPDPRSHRCAAGGTPPDPSDCSYDATRGAQQLSSVWSDPEFAASERALYYVRVLQIPTCRWSSFDALRLGVPPPAGVPTTLQERAITSPIWYAPPRAG